MAPNTNFHRLDALSTPTVPEQNISYPNPNVQGNPYIYLAVYSSVPVYEMMVRGIGVMRRRSDSFLNATQILKVAGVDKGKRTKILEKDIAMGVHEKVQGGYGRYQGTWIPFERAVELANAFNVSHLLSPLFDYTPPPPPMSLGNTPSAPITNRYAGLAPPPAPPLPVPTPQDQATVLSKAREQGLLPDAPEGSTRKRSRDSGGPEEFKRPRVEATNGFHSAPNVVGGEEDWKLRRSNQAPPAPNPSTDDLHLLDLHKTSLKSIFSLEPSSPHSIPDLSLTFPPEINVDLPIDENSHTALHWAAALARISIVKALVNYGADMYRGNNVGETPLIRAVLVTNNSDQDAFPRLLSVLGPSLRTVDESGRTVLHHAALVAGVKGRASSARYYMESVLEYVARVEKGRFKDLVDAQDAHGDTALNIAARVGNRALVRMLLEVGADKARGNKLGLYPGDFGVEVEDLAITPSESAINALRSTPPSSLPAQKSTEVLNSLTTILNTLSSDFSSELSTKSTHLDSTRSQLRAATLQLAEQRLQVSEWRKKVAEVDAKQQRIRNLERAIAEEDSFDWTGRTEIDGSPSSALAGPGFTYRGPASTLSNLPTGINIEFDADPLGPTEGASNALVHWVRLKGWYERVLGLLEERVRRLEGGESELEGRVARVVGRCCGVEMERVEGMLEGLLAGLESEGTGLEMTRVASFLSRVKDGSLQ